MLRVGWKTWGKEMIKSQSSSPGISVNLEQHNWRLPIGVILYKWSTYTTLQKVKKILFFFYIIKKIYWTRPNIYHIYIQIYLSNYLHGKITQHTILYEVTVISQTPGKMTLSTLGSASRNFAAAIAFLKCCFILTWSVFRPRLHI